LYLSLLDQGHGAFHAANGGNLQGVFDGDNSSRVAELDDDDSIEIVNQQEAGPIYQQPSPRHPPVLGNIPPNSHGHTQGRYAPVLPYSARTINQQPVRGPLRAALHHQEGFGAVDESNPAPSVATDYETHPTYRPNPPTDTLYGTGNSHIQRPGVHYSDNINAHMRSVLDQNQQLRSQSSTVHVPQGYAVDTNRYDPAPIADVGLGSHGNVDTASVYPSQWSTQEGYYDWQHAAQEADVLERGHGKPVWY